MSRLTTAQVISLGHYLEPDFDPASLTVSQLLGVLGYHNIKYPTPYSKPKLVQLFNEEIKTRSSKFKKERIKKENSIASDEGIKDGLTGQPLAATRRVCTIALHWCNPTMSLNRICPCDVLRVDYLRLPVRIKEHHPFSKSRCVEFCHNVFSAQFRFVNQAEKKASLCTTRTCRVIKGSTTSTSCTCRR